MKNRSIAIVGGKGYIGSALFAYCQAQKINAWVVGRQNTTNRDDSLISQYAASQSAIVHAISGADTVVHLASVSTPALGEKDPILDVQNIAFTLSLIKACQ